MYRLEDPTYKLHNVIPFQQCLFRAMCWMPNKLRGRVKNQHCPTHRVYTGQHVTGCYWQHLGSTGLEPGAFVQQYKKARTASAATLSQHCCLGTFQDIYIYIYLLIYTHHTTWVCSLFSHGFLIFDKKSADFAPGLFCTLPT